MRRPAVLLLLLLPLALPAGAEKPRKPKPPLSAEKYPMHDTHAAEHVTIAAEPGDTKETEPNTRLDYVHHGFMPVRIIVTNDSDRAITLEDARIHFIAADNTVIPAATDDELERRLFSRKSSATTKIPLPAPLPSIPIHHKPVDAQILRDDDDFGFKSTTVEPHTTVAGYLFYDIRSLDEPVLDHATIEVRTVRAVGDKDKELYSFLIPLHPSAEAAPAKPAASAAARKD